MSRKVTIELSDIEIENLRYAIGELRRVTRDSYYRWVGHGYEYSNSPVNKERYEAAESLFKKLVEDLQ